jgi:hypothetical protein
MGVTGLVEVLSVADGQDEPPGGIDDLEAVIVLHDLPRLLKSV